MAPSRPQSAPAAQDRDRRVRRTKAQLRQALTELLREKDLRSITVRELTERADVNRGTFYAHYKDIYDMLEQCEAQLFDSLGALLSGYTAQQLQGDLSPVLEEVFLFVEDNRDLIPILLTGQAKDPFFQRLYAVIREKCAGDWRGAYPVGTEEAGFAYALEFVVSGTVGLIQTWMHNGLQPPAREMAVFTGRLIQQGLTSL